MEKSSRMLEFPPPDQFYWEVIDTNHDGLIYKYCETIMSVLGVFSPIKSKSREKLIKGNFFLAFLFIQEIYKIQMNPF